MDNVSAALVSLVIAKSATISVKFLHCTEISISNTDNNDRAWQGRESDNDLFGLVHIMDCTIGQEEQHLISRGSLSSLPCVSFELLEQWSEQSWSTKSNSLDALGVSLYNVLNSLDLRVAWVSIDRETVGY